MMNRRKSINYKIENLKFYNILDLNSLFKSTMFFSSDQNGAEFDVAIIGGGIVGMATARELRVRHPNISFVVLEKEKEICKKQSCIL